MKYFKHSSNSINEGPIKGLIKEYGIEGYGYYYACVETIFKEGPGKYDMADPFSLNVLVEEFNIDPVKVESLMKFCNDKNLFSYKYLNRMDAEKVQK